MSRIPFEQPNGAVPNEVMWAEGRFTERTYLHRSFVLNMPNSQDHGQPARFVVKVFDEPAEIDSQGQEEFLVTSSPTGRSQVKLLVARDAGNVKSMEIQKVVNKELKTLLTLDRQGAASLIDLIRNLGHFPAEGEDTFVLDDSLLHQLLAEPQMVLQAYKADPAAVRKLIEEDSAAADVIAIANRRAAVADFKALLEDEELFEQQSGELGGPEHVWQQFLEANPWILGVSLSGQLMTSWNAEKLEQKVMGDSITTPGKRVDALMHTVGRIRMVAFAEIKHHKTALLMANEHRPGCWTPSRELAGGVVQVQQTVHLAAAHLSERLPQYDSDGAETGEYSYLLRPRSYLIVGHLEQLHGDNGIHREKHRSFELFRRSLNDPEIITFDELLARAEWHVELTESHVE